MPPRLYTVLVCRSDDFWAQFSYRCSSADDLATQFEGDWKKFVVISIDGEPIKPIQFVRQIKEIK